MTEACCKVQSHGKVLVEEALGTGSSSTWLFADLWVLGETDGHTHGATQTLVAIVMALNRIYK